MARREIVIDLCDRCTIGREERATETRDYATDPETWWRLKLCEQHAEMFDRDIGVWTRLSAEIDAPTGARGKSVYFTEERRREARRIAELRSEIQEREASKEFAERRAAELAQEEAVIRQRNELGAIPGALGWRLTTHAAERMVERGFEVKEVLEAAAQPEHTYRQPWRGPHIAIHQRGECRVVCNDDSKAIITVIDRNDTLETAPPNGADEKVKAAQ